MSRVPVIVRRSSVPTFCIKSLVILGVVPLAGGVPVFTGRCVMMKLCAVCRLVEVRSAEIAMVRRGRWAVCRPMHYRQWRRCGSGSSDDPALVRHVIFG